jgi:MYXO-CTERM domain-containing protein
MRVQQLLMRCIVVVCVLSGAANAALINPEFEADTVTTTDVYDPTGWDGFNDRYSTIAQARTGTQSLKIFGPFSQYGGAGATQRTDVTGGTLIAATAYGLDAGAANDGIRGSNFGLVQLNFFNASGAKLGPTFDSAPLNAAAPDGQWVLYSAQALAPATATQAEIVLLHVQMHNEPALMGGAIFFDDASLGVVPEPAAGMVGLLALGGLTLRRRGRAR